MAFYGASELRVFLTLEVEEVRPFFCIGEYLLSCNSRAFLRIELLKGYRHS